MAYNVELRVSAGGATPFTGDSQLVYIKTNKTLVDGLLDTNGKLQSAVVPDWLMNSPRNGGTITANKTFLQVFTQIKNALGLGSLSNSAAAALMNGAYVEVNADSVTITGDNYFQGFAAIGDDGVANQNSLTLERGDRLTFIGYQLADDQAEGWCSLNSFDFSTWPATLTVYYQTQSACQTAGGTWLAGAGGEQLELTNWSVTNSTYPVAIAGATEGESVKGIMSNVHVYKLHNLVNIKSLASEFGLDGNGQLTIDDATTTTKGKVQIGTGLEITGGIAALKKATTTTLGGVIVSTGLSVDGSGNITLNKATTGALGGVIVSTGLDVDASGNLTLKKGSTTQLGGVIAEATSGLTIDANGKITLTPQSGQIASDAEAKAGTNDTKIMTPLKTWTEVKQLLGLQIFTNLTNANAAGLAAGSYAFVQV